VTALVCSGHQPGLQQRLQQLVYVGCVTPATLLVQEATNLLLLDISKLSRDLFYQLVISATESLLYMLVFLLQ
jgi:hypothetical protein